MVKMTREPCQHQWSTIRSFRPQRLRVRREREREGNILVVVSCFSCCHFLSILSFPTAPLAQRQTQGENEREERTNERIKPRQSHPSETETQVIHPSIQPSGRKEPQCAGQRIVLVGKRLLVLQRTPSLPLTHCCVRACVCATVCLCGSLANSIDPHRLRFPHITYRSRFFSFLPFFALFSSSFTLSFCLSSSSSSSFSLPLQHTQGNSRVRRKRKKTIYRSDGPTDRWTATGEPLS